MQSRLTPFARRVRHLEASGLNTADARNCATSEGLDDSMPEPLDPWGSTEPASFDLAPYFTLESKQ